jgi:hemolysin activation/secretion protein
MTRQVRYFLAAALTLFPGTVLADAGSTLREYKDATILAPEKKQPEAIRYGDVPGKAQVTEQFAVQGPEVHIENINVVGNTTLSPDALHKVLAPYTGRPLTTLEIHAAADALMMAIRAAGPFAAKVYILPQDITNNTITFNVIEGHLAEDGIVLGRSSERVKDKVVRSQLEHTLKPGSVITADKYERAVYLTNDLPGIKGSENLIFPADKVGEAGFETIPEYENLVTGNVYYDNFGSYFTGRNRWGTTMELNSPTGHAEKVTAGANVSDYGTAFVYVDANMLLYPNGLRGGAMLDFLDYKTDEENDLRGTGLDGSLYLHYPVIRSRLTNLYSELYYTYTALEDENDLSTITDRTLHVGSLRLYGDRSDAMLGGGVTTARVEGYLGSVDLDDYEPFKEYDAFHADTQGGFSRATFSLTRLQHLIGNLQAYVAFNGQVASKRMDPSQSISFGGPYDFPGYHVGEIFGDEGWMIHTDLRYTFTALPWHGEMQISVFYDYGSITTHTVAIVNGFSVPGAVDTSYHLQSTGIGLSQTWDHFTIQGVLGWQVGNEIPDSLLDDGGDNNFQGWIHLVYSF